jgi:hypothetical protein
MPALEKKMKYFIFSILILLTSVMFAAAADIAIVKTVQGVVTIKRGETLVSAQPSATLQQGDLLITDNDSHVGVIFQDGSILTLQENSFLQIRNFLFEPLEQNFNFKLKLKRGTALFESGKIGTLAPEKFQFEIPEGTIGIRGTKFLVEVR